MASLAESSIASVPIKDLAALQEHLLNVSPRNVIDRIADPNRLTQSSLQHRQSEPSAATAQQVPEAATDGVNNDAAQQSHATNDINAHEDASAVIPDSAEPYRTPKASSNPRPPRPSSAKSAAAKMEMAMHQTPSQEAFRAMTHAESFHGYPGGDTQPMDSQVYRNYTESMAQSKSSVITPQKTSPNGKQQQICESTTEKTLHTYVEGETGYIDLQGAWEQGSPTARTQTSGIDELLASPQTQYQVPDAMQKPTMPETPALAGHKRRHSGEILSSGTTKKTPGYSQLFGAPATKVPVMSATQLFGQTQAPSSPPPDAPRSDPILTRPSPNLHHRVSLSSPPAFRSSPMASMHARPTALPGEPRDNYTSMQESDERRRIREQFEMDMPVLGEDEDEDDQDDDEPRVHEQRRTQRAMSDQALREWSKMRAPSRPGSRPGSSRKQPATIDLVTPATVRRQGERVEFEFNEDSDEDLPMNEDDPEKASVEGQDEVDEYDELGQTVMRSQRDDRESVVGDDEGDDGEDRMNEREDGGLVKHAVTEGMQTAKQASQHASAPEKAVSATQPSAVADSQPPLQSYQHTAKTSTQQPTTSSFVPGSQYTGKTSEEQALLKASILRQSTASQFQGDEEVDKVPSSPPLPETSSTVPNGTVAASLERRRMLAHFQQPQFTKKETTDEQEIPESDALMAEESRPVLARPAPAAAGESTSVPAPFSTAQTHISTSGPSPAKNTSTIDRSPFKTFASQHSRLSVDSPRKRLGIRRMESIAGDPSPPDASGEAELDIEGIMSDVMTAEDHAFIDMMSSPVSEKPNKRRKLAHQPAKVVLSRNASPENAVEDAVEDVLEVQMTEDYEKSPSKVTGIPMKTVELLEARPEQTRVLRNSPSKGNELPIATPENALAPKGTQESAKKREQAGAAAVSQLLAARSTRPTRSAKVSGRGRKAAPTELEPATLKRGAKAKPSRLEGDSTEGELVDEQIHSESVEHVRQPDAATGSMGLDGAGLVLRAAQSTPTVVRVLTTAGLADSAPAITAPNRIFALFKGTPSNFYPATWLSTSHDGKSYKIAFADTPITTIDANHVRTLDLRVGDQVKVDGKDMRNKAWMVTGFGRVTPTDDERAMGTDIFGRTIVKVHAKASRNSLPANSAAIHGDGDVVEVLVDNIYITHSMWPAFDDRTFTPPDVAGRSTTRLATPSTGLQTPDAETPGSRARRSVVPTAKAAIRKSHLREESVVSRDGRLDTGLFAGMAFAISYGSNESEKAQITGHIQRNGGIMLENGFDELFDVPNLDEPVSPIKRTPAKQKQADVAQTSGLRLHPEYEHLGFVALIADRHSRRAKYMQALALGLPTLSARWITDSLKAATEPNTNPVPWDRYLLAAGESSYLNGAVRSRTLPSYSAGGAKLATTIAARSLLLNGEGVLIVAPKKHKATWERRKAYAFLTLALGAGSVKRVSDVTEATATVAQAAGWKWVYVDGSVADAGSALVSTTSGDGGKKRKRGDDAAAPKATDAKSMSAPALNGLVKVVNDEFVVQSLILGALVD